MSGATEVLEILLRSLRYSARSMIRAPAAEIVTILTVGIGIAACTAVFTGVNGVFLRPLPYADSDRLVVISGSLKDRPFPISYPEFLDWQRQNRSFADLAAFGQPLDVNLVGAGEPLRVRVVIVSASFWTVLGVRPLLGRGFLPEEDRPSSPGRVVISHELWSRAFGADRTILGRPIAINDRAYTVIGVLPPGAQYPLDADAWIPVGLQPILNRRVRGLEVLGRLNHHSSVQAAAADMKTIAHRLEIDYPLSNRGFGVQVMPLRDRITGNARLLVAVLACSVTLMLLIACLNVAGVHLARAVTREPEMSLRMALGASRARIVLDLIAENFLRLAGVCVIGLIGGAWAAMSVRGLVPGYAVESLGTDAVVVGFSLLTSVVATAAFGFAPVLRISRIAAVCALTARGRGATNWRSLRVRSLATVAQVAISMVLVVATGLLLKSLHNVQALRPGFRLDHITSFGVALPVVNGDVAAGKYRLVLDRLRSIPGVQGAAAASCFPLGRRQLDSSFQIDGEPPAPPEERKLAGMGCISARYASLMGIPVLNGREFTEQDRGPAARRVVIVNEAFARRFFPQGPRGAGAVGKTLVLPGPLRVEIVGVIGNVLREPIGAPPQEEIYRNCDQLPSRWITFVLRTAIASPIPGSTLRRAVHEVDGNLPLFDLQTAEQALARSLFQPKMLAAIPAIFASFALIVAAVGLYGHFAYSTALRRRELAIRIALGAQRFHIIMLVIRSGLLQSATGIAAGSLLSLMFVPILRGLLYRVIPADLPTLLLAAALLLLVSVIATAVPAYRAAKTTLTHIIAAE